ncbi:MAG: hypothetical protein HFI86_02180 [Bacilli bacterium]|nr:hypothetical protein [Bacilli bacterium]
MLFGIVFIIIFIIGFAFGLAIPFILQRLGMYKNNQFVIKDNDIKPESLTNEIINEWQNGKIGE